MGYRGFSRWVCLVSTAKAKQNYVFAIDKKTKFTKKYWAIYWESRTEMNYIDMHHWAFEGGL